MVLGHRTVVIPRDSMFIVFMVVTIQAQQFPVTAIGRIVVVVMVFVMDRKLA